MIEWEVRPTQKRSYRVRKDGDMRTAVTSSFGFARVLANLLNEAERQGLQREGDAR